MLLLLFILFLPLSWGSAIISLLNLNLLLLATMNPKLGVIESDSVKYDLLLSIILKNPLVIFHTWVENGGMEHILALFFLYPCCCSIISNLFDRSYYYFYRLSNYPFCYILNR